MLAECTNCDHVNDVTTTYPITKQTLTDFYKEE